MKKIFFFMTALSFILCGCGNSSYEDTYSSDDYYSNSNYTSDYDYSSDYDYDSDYGSGYGYDKSDPYYSSNDHNNDGKISDSEFQDAMGDAIDDLLEEYGY